MSSKNAPAKAAALMIKHWNMLSTHGSPLTMFVDDCLAPFGFPLEYEQTEQQREVLFELGALYADFVRHNPYDDFFVSIHPQMTGKWHQSSLGQFFTPPSVCSVMADMMLGSKEKIQATIEEKGGFSISDPCVGAGGLPLAACRTLMGMDLLEKASFDCIDLDISCVRMALLQFVANKLIGHPAPEEFIIHHGNALKLDYKPYAGWVSPKREVESSEKIALAANGGK